MATRKKVKWMAGVAAALGLGTVEASIAGDNWTVGDVCGAATSAYFFLHSPPVVLGAVDGWIVLRSESGNTYDCRAVGDRVYFRWKIDRGPMSGEVRFTVDGPTLLVQTDMGSKSFEIGRSGWRSVD